MMLQSELRSLGLHCRDLGTGMVEIKDDVSSNLQYQLGKILTKYGLELVLDNKSMIITKIKALINELIDNPEEERKIVLSSYMSDKLHYNYKYLYNLFIGVTGMSINWYYITQKIERVKYLIAYEQLPVSEISYRLNYSSVAHLSAQFKKVTGLTPSEYKNMEKNTTFREHAVKNAGFELKLA
jgi:AraC-like DNA-binding protein